MHKQLETQKEKVRKRLEDLKPIFALASIGDFSKDVALYEEDDEFTETYIGVQMMLEVIRGQLSELNQLNEKLELQVKELQRENELRSEDHRKDEFISVLGHELRNPLAPIMYGTELLRLKTPTIPLGDTEVSETLSLIDRQSHRMSKLIDVLLDASRIMRGRIVLKFSSLNLADSIEDSIRSVRHLIDEKKQHLTFTLPKNTIIIFADPLRLEEIFTNILSNASKFTPSGGEISVKLETDADEVRVRIKDTGIGIRKDDQKKIFDAFVHADDHAKNTEEGLGIGLMISKSFAKLHGGDVTVLSTGLHKGSEFTVSLPRNVDAESSKQENSDDERFSVPRVRKRVLIVDDNQDLADALGRLLKKLGQEVSIAYDGASALSSVELFHPEVIMLDLAMPVMDGYEVAKKIKSDPQFVATRLIALSGFGQDSDKERTKAAGFDMHLVKPPSVKDLMYSVIH